MLQTKNFVLEHSFNFALKIIDYCELLESKRKFVVANQLMRSGTSVGANIREAQNPHSRADFISKFVIASKEASEAEYWLLLCKESATYPDPGDLIERIVELRKLISKIISSSKKNY